MSFKIRKDTTRLYKIKKANNYRAISTLIKSIKQIRLHPEFESFKYNYSLNRVVQCI